LLADLFYPGPAGRRPVGPLFCCIAANFHDCVLLFLLRIPCEAFAAICLLLIAAISRPEGLPNAPYSPRRGESALQCDRGRGGIGLLYGTFVAFMGFSMRSGIGILCVSLNMRLKMLF
jgi:hypothetical protein